LENKIKSKEKSNILKQINPQNQTIHTNQISKQKMISTKLNGLFDFVTMNWYLGDLVLVWNNPNMSQSLTLNKKNKIKYYIRW